MDQNKLNHLSLITTPSDIPSKLDFIRLIKDFSATKTWKKVTLNPFMIDCCNAAVISYTCAAAAAEWIFLTVKATYSALPAVLSFLHILFC